MQSITRELDLHDLIIIAIYCWCPAQTLTASGTGGLLLLPVNLEEAFIKALLFFRLPLVIRSGWCDEVDPVIVAALDKLLGLSVVRVSQMLFG